MLARFSRSFPDWQLWRLVLVLLLTPALVAAPAFMAGSVAVAQDDEEDEDEDSGDEEDEDSGDEEDEDGGDEGEEEDDFEGEDEEEEEEEEGEPQPPVTAGGMFTKKTYPVAELERPLTVIQGMFEVRGGIDIDVSDETAFEVFRLKLDGRYGLADHVELQAIIDFLISGDRALLLPPAPVDGEDVGGVTSPVSLFGFGLEGALYYDLVHFRSIAALTILPKADNPEEDDFGFDLILGVPFRYRIKPQIAIVALDEIMTIHLAGGKPDLTVGVGGVFQVIEQVALTARAEVFVPAFNTKFVTVPLTAAAQFSPNNQFDIGIEFTLPVDVRNEETRFSKRSALLFVQTRL
jgi:hypothetical protein